MAKWQALALGMGLLGASGGAVMAQVPQLSNSDYERAAAMLADRTTPLVDGLVERGEWLDPLHYFHRLRNGAAIQYRILDAASGRSGEAFDHEALARAINAASKDGKPARPASAGKLAVSRVQLVDGGVVQVDTAQGRFSCKGKACKALPSPAKGKEPGNASPDGKSEVFVRDWNLWLRDLASGTETRLTSDGEPDYGYATDNAGWKHTDNAIVKWSPDGRKLATFRQDQRRVRTMTMVGTNVGAPKVQQWKYPFAGDEHVIMIERVVIDLSGAQPAVVRLDLPAEPHRSTCSDDLVCDGGWEDVQWAADGNTLAFVSTDRGHKSATLHVADAATGKVRDVFTETVATQYQSAPALSGVNWRYLPESNEFIWFSQQSDWGHLYLHDLDSGKLKRQLTSGEWNVTRIDHVDLAGRSLLVRGVGREAGRDPYYVHAYRVGMDDGQLRLLTAEDANHALAASPDGKYLLDTWSTWSTAPVTVLRDAGDGKVLAELARADLSRLQAAGWVAPEAVTTKARDGKTDIYGQLFKPSHFDASKKYPVVLYIYPGPQVGSVRSRSFMPAHGDHQALAELGFIVVAIDGMGTPLRSKSFQDAYYGNMIDNTLPDQVAALKELAARHPWFDISRLGIWGHSGGGNATATAMFRYPDLFKVGIAESGNHDNLSYEDDWAERYHGLLETREDGTSNYTGQDNAAHAGNLKGKLYLIHGMLDDNVPVQNTLLVVEALVKANKDFDLLLLPHARHGFGKDSYYVMRKRWDYFVRHLQGAEPPAQFELKPLD